MHCCHKACDMELTCCFCDALLSYCLKDVYIGQQLRCLSSVALTAKLFVPMMVHKLECQRAINPILDPMLDSCIADIQLNTQHPACLLQLRVVSVTFQYTNCTQDKYTIECGTNGQWRRHQCTKLPQYHSLQGLLMRLCGYQNQTRAGTLLGYADLSYHTCRVHQVLLLPCLHNRSQSATSTGSAVEGSKLATRHQVKLFIFVLLDQPQQPLLDLGCAGSPGLTVTPGPLAPAPYPTLIPYDSFDTSNTPVSIFS